MMISYYEVRPSDQGEYTLYVYVDSLLNEFASEWNANGEEKGSLVEAAKNIVHERFPELKVTFVKVMCSGMVVSSFSLGSVLKSAKAMTNPTNSHVVQPQIYYEVVVGDTLWSLSSKYAVAIDDIKRANRLTSDQLAIGQRLIIPNALHVVQQGDYLSALAKKYGTTVAAIKQANQLTTDKVKIGQKLWIPKNIEVPSMPPISSNTTYTVQSGDSLSGIAKKYGTTVTAIKGANNLSSDTIYIGQTLQIPSGEAQQAERAGQATEYIVQPGDSLSGIAKKYGTTVTAIKGANNLSSDTIYAGQTLQIPSGEAQQVERMGQATEYTVQPGDSLSGIAKKYGTTVTAIKGANNLSSDTIYAGQTLQIPSGEAQQVERTESTTTYTVRAGDSLWTIARAYGTSVDDVKRLNGLTTDRLFVGQVLIVPKAQEGVQTKNQITYTTHVVQPGDTLWDISIQYGIPQRELLEVNQLTTNSALSVGQTLTIPVHHIATKPVVSERHGELLQWWTEAQYVFPIGKEAKVIDFETGKSFQIKRTIGANHADCETVSTTDTNIAKSIWGGYSWKTRAVLIEVDGRKLAASMSFMPHGVEYIKGNGIDGHFDVHFYESTRHKDGKIDPYHQEEVKIAAGVSG
ncbi:muramidase family protein [Bacillus kexueae]|uniref:muramidase family protein n=1 Tax=Aeribacillus kexueae TaxID=2078952 RepID=UPI001FB023CF|nr:LysM peptidoglycan-binding domain-containing protein [Bacillus kexueae]